MAEKNTTTTTAEQPDVIIRARGFWDKYSKPIIYIGSAVILIIGGWYAYKNLYVAPREQKANELIFPAENLFDKMGTTGFNKDSVNIVLNGGSLEGSKVTGMLSIINNYGGTETGNRAKYIAGASYFQIHEFDKAIKFLKDFDPSNAKQIASKADIILGHIYAEKNNVDEALGYYKKAATVNEEDESTTPYALLMAASYAATKGKTKEAIELYKEVKEKYPANQAVTSGDVEKHLAFLGEFK